MKSRFTFAGRSSEEFYLTVEKLPIISAPAKKYSTISVPGRNGDLHIEEKAFQNYTQPYECYFHAPDLTAPEVAHAIKGWLMGSRGPQKLRDTYDPSYFHNATFLGPIDIERLLNEYGRCVISFDCAPQAFLVSGQERKVFTVAGSLHNPTAFSAQPLITVYGSGAGSVTVGNATVQIKEMVDMLILDCDTQNAYRQLGEGAPENKNRTIYAPVFPELTPGDNPVSWNGAVERVEIVPRWWTL